MPIYSYKCKQCATEFDRLVSIARRDMQNCSELLCRSSDLVRIMPVVPIHYKCLGFYTTDIAAKKPS